MADPRFNRRQLLTAGALASVVAADAGRVQARTITDGMPWEPGVADRPYEATHPVTQTGFDYFEPEEVRFLEAAVSRLIPNDENGPGALEVGVVTFLDRQMTGAYGRAQRWYMLGPWGDGVPTQGYQSRLNPAQLYRAGIKAVNAHCQSAKGKVFADLSESDRDEILKGLDEKTIKFEHLDAKTFFDALLQNTIEGYFCDPIYGGNRDMAAWKMIGFPGARYDYRDYVPRHNERYTLPPVSLAGRPGWNPKS